MHAEDMLMNRETCIDVFAIILQRTFRLLCGISRLFVVILISRKLMTRPQIWDRIFFRRLLYSQFEC